MLQFIKEEKGISLTELLVTATILWVVIGAVYTLLIGGEDIFNIGDKQVAAQQSARIAFMRMVKEVRQSYQLVDTVSYPSPPTSSTTLSVRGIQVVEETLGNTGDDRTYQAQYYPWLSDASPVIYVGSSIAGSGYTINSSQGQVVFSTADSTRTVKASYTRDVYLQYTLVSNSLRRRVYRQSDGATLEDTVVAENVANGTQAVFSRDDATSNLIRVTLLIDEDASKPPAAFRLETEIRLRK